MNGIQLIATMALAAGVMGTYAQTTANATRNGSHVLQGDFRAGGSPAFAENNGNSKRVGYGGSSATSRCNQPIWGLDLPQIPAGETLTAATLTVDVTSINGSPLFFEVLASLMTATEVSEFAAAPADYFVAEAAPLDTVLSGGIVFSQFAQSDLPVGGTLEIPVTGAALDRLNSLYDAAGNPTQSTVWFRLSTSVANDPAEFETGDRIQFADGDSTTEAAFGLILGWAPVPKFIADPVVKANVSWGTDYAVLSQTLADSATNSAGSATFYEKNGGPDWLVVATNGALSGVADMVGTNEFPIKAILGENFAAATLQIIVDPLGNPPEFTVGSIIKADAAFNEDYALQAQSLTNSATDIDGDTLSYFKNGGPAWLNVASNGVLSGVCDVLGTNTFTIAVDDGNGNSDTALLEIFVPTIGSSPEFTVDPIVKADGERDADYALESQTLAGSATDPEGDALIYLKTDGPAWLNVASNGVLSGVCEVEGTNTFTVMVEDENGNSDSATLLIFVAPPPQPPILVGWERWVGGAGAVCPATVETNGFTGVASNVGGFAADRYAACNDGTFGTLSIPAASSDISVNEEGMRVKNAASDLSFEFSIDNTSEAAVDLGTFHFDALTKTIENGSPEWTLEVVSGGITEGVVSNAAVGFVGGTANLDDYDVDLTGLADHTLEAGGNVLFRLTFSGFAGVTNSKMDLDNVAVTEKLSLMDVEPPVMNSEVSEGNITISWTSDGSFKLQTRSSLISGGWMDVPGATTSPIVISATNDVEFLRLIEQ